ADNFSGVSVLLNDGAWTGPHPGPGGGTPGSGHFPGPGASVPTRPALLPPAGGVEAQLADAAFPDRWPLAHAVPVAYPSPPLPPQENARPGNVTTTSPAPGLEETRPRTYPRPAALATPR